MSFIDTLLLKDAHATRPQETRAVENPVSKRPFMLSNDSEETLVDTSPETRGSSEASSLLYVSSKGYFFQ